jgi:CRISPR-associated protein Csm4
MTLYRIRFKLCSAIVTPLKGDTIWGHIVWGIASHEGSNAVAIFIEEERAEPPALVVSSAFPAGMICRSLPAPQDRDSSLTSEEAYSKIKKEKKIRYVPASDYFTVKETKDKVKENPFKSVQIMHNTINRTVNNVEEGGGGLYSTEEMWPKIPDWDLYILSSLQPSRIKELLGWAFENGYGADASTGKGKIEISGEPIPVNPKEHGNTYMALGPFVNSKNEIANLRADIFVRSGKLGGAFAACLSPFKKPVVLYDEGAVFKCDKSIKYTGMLLEKMHSNEEICHSGFTPVIPVDGKE